MRREILVFIAGPISKGDLRANIRVACEAGIALMKAGLAVHVPHLTCFMGQVYEGPVLSPRSCRRARLSKIGMECHSLKSAGAMPF